MKIVHEVGDFYAVYDCAANMRSYFKHTVPTTHRRYESQPKPRWVVHRKYITQFTGLVPKQDPHATLFLTQEAPLFMIDAAWKALALAYHPDRGGDPEKFRNAQTAYKELKKNAGIDVGDDAKKETS